MAVRRLLVGNRRFRISRVFGTRTVVQTAVWSTVAIAVLAVYRTPALLDGSLSVDAVLAAIPVVLIPLVVGVIGAGLVLLNTVRELRYLLFGRRRRYQGTYDQGPDDDSEGGGLFESLGGIGDFDGDDGE